MKIIIKKSRGNCFDNLLKNAIIWTAHVKYIQFYDLQQNAETL